MAIVEVILVLVAVGTVAVLEVVNVKVPPVLEGVIAKVASTSVAVIIVATPEVVDVVEVLPIAY